MPLKSDQTEEKNVPSVLHVILDFSAVPFVDTVGCKVIQHVSLLVYMFISMHIGRSRMHVVRNVWFVPLFVFDTAFLYIEHFHMTSHWTLIV